MVAVSGPSQQLPVVPSFVEKLRFRTQVTIHVCGCDSCPWGRVAKTPGASSSAFCLFSRNAPLRTGQLMGPS
jgi:hypothetical protein